MTDNAKFMSLKCSPVHKVLVALYSPWKCNHY